MVDLVNYKKLKTAAIILSIFAVICIAGTLLAPKPDVDTEPYITNIVIIESCKYVVVRKRHSNSVDVEHYEACDNPKHYKTKANE